MAIVEIILLVIVVELAVLVVAVGAIAREARICNRITAQATGFMNTAKETLEQQHVMDKLHLYQHGYGFDEAEVAPPAGALTEHDLQGLGISPDDEPEPRT